MALINCSECSKGISSEAGSCPHCGAPVKKPAATGAKPLSTRIATGIFGLMVLGLFGFIWNFLSGSKQDDGKPDAQTPPTQVQRLKPEQIVRFPKSRFACLTQAEYEEATLHAVRKEATKFNAMFEKFHCFELAANMDFKILRIDSHADYDMIEIVPATSSKTDGAFTEWDYPK